LGGLSVSPKLIQTDFKKVRGKVIQKPNLFTILKALRVFGFVKQVGHGEYVVDYNGVRNRLKERRVEYLKDLDDFDDLSGEVEDYFKKASLSHTRPGVEYLGFSEVFNRIARQLNSAKSYYATTKFPIIAYPPELMNGLDIIKYGKTIWTNCLEKNRLQMNCLTNLDIKHVYKQAIRARQSKKQALKTCENTINNLEMIIEKHKNIRVYLTKELLGLDIILAENKTPEDFYIFIRDEKQLVTGGVYIRSQPTAMTTKEQFTERCKKAILINKNNSEKIFNNIRKQ